MTEEQARNLEIWQKANDAERVSGTIARLAKEYGITRQRVHQIITAQDKEQGYTPAFGPNGGYPVQMTGWYTTSEQRSEVLAYCHDHNIPVSQLIRLAVARFIAQT